MCTVMVTGVGAIIGYGILKSLRKSDASLVLVGSDIYRDAVGQKWCDSFRPAPYTSDTAYLGWLQSIINEFKVDLLIPGIEQDLHFFSDNRKVISEFGAKIAVNCPRLVEVTKDKWKTYSELQKFDKGLAIESHAAGDFTFFRKSLGLPFLLKPRRSYASKGIIKIENELQFSMHSSDIGNHLIAQPIVGSDDEEYTVGSFGDGSGEVKASITFARRLALDGSTVKARVVHDQSIQDKVESIFRFFRPVGPTNLQLRKTNTGWKLLEINPRISSSTSLRTAFGYNESQMCVDYFHRGKTVTQPSIQLGFATRYIEDSVTYASDHI